MAVAIHGVDMPVLAELGKDHDVVLPGAGLSVDEDEGFFAVVGTFGIVDDGPVRESDLLFDEAGLEGLAHVGLPVMGGLIDVDAGGCRGDEEERSEGEAGDLEDLQKDLHSFSFLSNKVGNVVKV